MRIALIGSARFPATPPFAGGLEAHTWQLASGLRARGHEVTVFDAARGDAFEPSATSRADISAGPIETLREHHLYLSVIREIATGTFDVVHNNSTHHLPIAMTPLLGAPLVTTLHCPPTPWLESALAICGSERGTLVSVSQHNADSWRHAAEVHVVHNGVDTTVWRPTDGPRTGAVWVGRVVPEKAPHLAIDAARRAGFPIRLAGPVHDPRYFHAEIAPRLGDDAVHVGHLDVAETVALVASAEVALVTPVWAEPFGLVVIEALACGTPVAAFDTGAMPELIDREVGRLAPTGDVDALARAATEAVGLSNERCRRRACVDHSVELMLARYESILVEAAGLAVRTGVA